MTKTTQPTATKYPDFDAIVNGLLKSSRIERRRVAEADGLSSSSSMRATDAVHRAHFTVGFHGHRQTGKTHWAASHIDPTTMVVCSNTSYAETMLDKATELTGYDRNWLCRQITTARSIHLFLASEEAHRQPPRDPTEELVAIRRRMMRGETKWFPPPEGGEPLMGVRRVIIDEFSLMNRSSGLTLEEIARWSRAGGQVPELIVIYA